MRVGGSAHSRVCVRGDENKHFFQLILGKPHLPEPSYGAPFQGFIAEVRLYNYALSEQEVKLRAQMALEAIGGARSEKD